MSADVAYSGSRREAPDRLPESFGFWQAEWGIVSGSALMVYSVWSLDRREVSSLSRSRC